VPWWCRIASNIPSVPKKLEIVGSPTKSFASMPTKTCSPVSIQDWSNGLRLVQNCVLGCGWPIASGCWFTKCLQCCCVTDKWPLLDFDGRYAATTWRSFWSRPCRTVQQYLLRPVGLCPNDFTLCTAQFMLSTPMPPGWYLPVLLSVVLYAVVMLIDSHQPLVHSGRQSPPGSLCQAMLFLVVRKMLISAKFTKPQILSFFSLFCCLQPASKVLQADL